MYEFNSNIFTDDDFFAARKIAEANARAEMTQEQIEDTGLERVLLVLDEDLPIGSETDLDSTLGTDVSSPFDTSTSDVASQGTDFGHLSRTSSMNSNLNTAGPVRIYGKKKSNRGRPAVKSAVLTTPEKRNQLHAAKRSAKKRQMEERAKNLPVKRGRPKTMHQQIKRQHLKYRSNNRKSNRKGNRKSNRRKNKMKIVIFVLFAMI